MEARRSIHCWTNAPSLVCRPLALLLLIGILTVVPGDRVAGAGFVGQVDNADKHADKPVTLAYARQITMLIKGTWGRLLERHTDLAYGTVVVHASVDRRGKIHDPRIVSGSPDENLRRVALRAVSKTGLPAMPERSVEELKGERLSINVTFDFRPLPAPAREPAHR